MTHRRRPPLASTGRPRRAPARHGRGLALPAVVFMLTVLGLMLAGAVSLASRGAQSGELELQAVRALQAARAGTEWGAWMVADPAANRAPGPTALPDCIPSSTLSLPSPLDAFDVRVVCTRHPATGTVDEGGLKLVSYQITATATAAAEGDARRVERSVEARLTICKNPGGLPPRFAC